MVVILSSITIDYLYDDPSTAFKEDFARDLIGYLLPVPFLLFPSLFSSFVARWYTYQPAHGNTALAIAWAMIIINFIIALMEVR
jgi:hypothetical protein